MGVAPRRERLYEEKQKRTHFRNVRYAAFPRITTLTAPRPVRPVLNVRIYKFEINHLFLGEPRNPEMHQFLQPHVW